MQIGDKVEVIAGFYYGETGRVSEIKDNAFVVRMDIDDDCYLMYAEELKVVE